MFLNLSILASVSAICRSGTLGVGLAPSRSDRNLAYREMSHNWCEEGVMFLSGAYRTPLTPLSAPHLRLSKFGPPIVCLFACTRIRETLLTGDTDMELSY
ncbi:hypothetical protein VTO58DRAFT_108020 [Aureobasidium pullulans]